MVLATAQCLDPETNRVLDGWQFSGTDRLGSLILPIKNIPVIFLLKAANLLYAKEGGSTKTKSLWAHSPKGLII